MNNSFERLEQKTFQSYWDDGLLDVMTGFVLVAIGVSWWLDAFIWGIFFPPVCASLWFPLRKKLVEPRIGYVEFSGKRELKGRSFRMNMMMFLTGIVLLVLLLYFAGNVPNTDLARYLVAGLPAFLLSLMAFPFGMFTGCRRYYIYSLILLTVSVTTIIMGLEPGLPILAGGAAILVIGITIMVRFMASHPLEPGAPA